jgi:integrase
MARGKRHRVATGIYSDVSGFSVIVSVHGIPHEERHPHGTPLETLRAARKALRRLHEETPPPKRRGTLATDVAHYLATLPKGKTRDDADTLFEAWKDAGFFDRNTETIEPKEIAAQLQVFATLTKPNGQRRYSPKTINELRRLLGSVFITKHGKRGDNPVRDVPRERVVYDDPRGFGYDLIESILAEMPDRGQGKKGEERGTVNLTKLRLRAMAYTGFHQLELGNISERDLRELAKKRVWMAGRRKGEGTKGGWHPLTKAGVDALRALWRAGGLGPFGTRSMATSWNRAIDKAKATWRSTYPKKPWPLPANVRPYDLRHSYGTAVYQQTGDIRAAQRLLRHATLATTLRYTAAAVDARAQQAADALEALHARATMVPRARGKRLQKAPPSPFTASSERTSRTPRKSGDSAEIVPE